MTEDEWKQRFAAELIRFEVLEHEEHLSTMAHHLWLSSSGGEPEAIAFAVAEAWPGRQSNSDHHLVAEARHRIRETRAMLHRLKEQRVENEIKLLDAHAALCRDHFVAGTAAVDSFAAIVSGLPERVYAEFPSLPVVDPHVQ